jgi:2-polyprenyl-3-methyl-5-hydroxy-6-metoxy-1,4-benzoquinol methylase
MAYWFSPKRPEPVPVAGESGSARPLRRSSGLAELNRILSGREALNILDLGPTSPRNIQHLTGLGHKVYNEDVLLASLDPKYVMSDPEGKHVADVERFAAENLNYPPAEFDAILCWDICDYMQDGMVRVFAQRLEGMLRPGGALLAYFHTRDAGPDAPYFRFHIAGDDLLELQRGPQFRLQRVFNNRHIENLFKGCTNIKFFLARDDVREVLVVR